MSIDRIGKGGGAPPVSPKEAEATQRPEGASRPFEVRAEKAGAAHPADAVDKSASTPLERLRAGEINVERYLDLKVEDATKHLTGIPPAQLESIRASLRHRLATDPALTALVKQATGFEPPPPKDE
jgi:hypothetical protein